MLAIDSERAHKVTKELVEQARAILNELVRLAKENPTEYQALSEKGKIDINEQLIAKIGKFIGIAMLYMNEDVLGFIQTAKTSLVDLNSFHEFLTQSEEIIKKTIIQIKEDIRMGGAVQLNLFKKEHLDGT